MQLCKKTFCRLIALLCLILVAYKLSCDSTYLYFCYLTGSTRHLTYILLAAAFVAGSALVLFSGWCRKLSRRQAILAAAAIFAAMMLVQLALILIAFRHYLPWADSLSVINEAISMASQNTPPRVPSSVTSGRYFAMYGNNYFFTILLYWYFRFFRLLGLTSYWMEALFLNMAAIDLGVFFTFASVRRLAGPGRALGMLALCAVNPLVYVFLPFVYTNTFSIPFTMGIFYLCICLYQSKPGRARLLLAAALGLLIAFGIQIRVTTLIPCIAVGMAACVYGLGRLGRKLQPSPAEAGAQIPGSRSLASRSQAFLARRSLPLSCAVFLLALALAFGFCQASIRRYVPEELRVQNFPVTHWLMMGLWGYGGYSAEDEEFTYQFPTKEEKIAANLEEIGNRLEVHSPESLFALGKTKFKETWTAQLNGLYLETGRTQGYSVLQKYLFGFKNDLLIYYYQTFQVLLDVLMLIGLAWQLKAPRKQFSRWPFTLTLFGFFLFYLIWEANCRYSVCLTLLLCLVAYGGVEALLALPENRLLTRLWQPGGSAFLQKAQRLRPFESPRRFLRSLAALLLLCAVILPCAYAMYRNLPQYTQPFIPKVDYSVNMVSRSYHEASVDGVAGEGQVAAQTFTTAHPFNEIGVYVSYSGEEEWQDSMKEEILYQFRLLDSKGAELARQEFGPESGSAYYKLFGFDLVTPDGPSTYTIEISRAPGCPAGAEDLLSFQYFDFDAYDYIEGGELSVDGVPLPNRDMVFMVNYSYTGPYTTPARYAAVCAVLLAGLAALLLVLLLDGKRGHGLQEPAANQNPK